MKRWQVVVTFPGSSVCLGLYDTRKQADEAMKRYRDRETFGIPKTFLKVEVLRNTVVGDRIWYDI